MSLTSKSTSLSTLLLLLVAYLLYCDNAQARILLPNTVVTSSLNTTARTEAAAEAIVVPAAAAKASSSEASLLGDATKKSKLETAKQNPVNLEPATAVVVRQSSSVVQDWSLVCKELCGAGFGGVPCAAVCSPTKTVATDDQPSAVSRIASDEEVLSRNANKLLICKDLCRLQLGNEACNCGQPLIELTPNERDEVCHTFCVNGKITLHGCSPCKLVKNGIKLDLGTSKKLRESLRTTLTTNSNTSSSTTTIKETSTQNATHGSKAKETDYIKDNNNTSNKVDIVDSGVRSDNGSTPDWNELCKSLCKTGDGGSLCKCDLSPFFS